MGKTASKEKTSTGNADLDLAVAGINKKFGDGALMRLGDATKMNVSVISTGSIAVDLALGVGGLPRGRTVEIYGPESSGKTTFCLSVIAEAQRQGGNAVFVDVDPDLRRQIQLSTNRLCGMHRANHRAAVESVESGSVDSALGAGKMQAFGQILGHRFSLNSTFIGQFRIGNAFAAVL